MREPYQGLKTRPRTLARATAIPQRECWDWVSQNAERAESAGALELGLAHHKVY